MKYYKFNMDVTIFLVCTTIASIIIRGYQYGIDNQVEQIPLVMRAIDKNFITQDFTINAGSLFTPRYFYIQTLAFLAKFVPLSNVYFLLTVLSNFAIAVVTFQFAKIIFPRFQVSWMMSVVTVLSVESLQIGGSGSIVSSILVPQLLAVPFGLISFISALKRKIILSAFFAGVGSLFHPQVGILTGAISFSVPFIMGVLGLYKIDFRKVLISAFTLGLFGYLWFAASRSFVGVNTIEFIKSYVYFRAPHHHAPSTWPLIQFVELGSILVGFFILLRSYKSGLNISKETKYFLTIFVGAICILFFGGYIFVEIIPTRLWVNIQPFRMVFLLKWIVLTILGGYIGKLLFGVDKLKLFSGITLFISLLTPITTGLGLILRNLNSNILIYTLPVIVFIQLHLINPVPRITLLLFILTGLVAIYVLNKKYFTRIIFVSTLILVFIVNQSVISTPFDRFRPQISLNDIKTDESEVARYAKNNLPKESLYVVPAYFGQFRFLAERAILVDWTSDPFDDEVRVEWQQRIIETYGDDPSKFEIAYRYISDERLKKLKNKYKVSYAILYKDTVTTLTLIYENEKYKIIQI